MGKTKQKLPEFGDTEAIRRMREAAASDEAIAEERKMKGKVFKVRVKYCLVEDREKTLEVVALNHDDAEGVACDQILEEEGTADEDSIDARVLDVWEQGRGQDDKKTIEMFPNPNT